MGKPTICIGENKDADQLRGNREADQRLCFATRIVQFFFYLNPKFQASSSFLCLYRSDLFGNHIVGFSTRRLKYFLMKFSHYYSSRKLCVLHGHVFVMTKLTLVLT